MPVTWEGLNDPEGIIEIVDGDLLFTPTSEDAFGTFTAFDHQDVSIQMQLRFLGEPSDSAFVGASFRRNVLGAYWAAISMSGELAVGFSQGSTTAAGQRNVFIGDQSIIRNDIHLLVNMQGDTISATAWEDGSDMANAPQVTWTV